MKNAKMNVSDDGILTIQIDLKKGLGESASGKTFLIARCDGRAEDFNTPNGMHGICLTVYKYKEEKKQKAEKPKEQLVDTGWTTTKSASGKVTREKNVGIAPGQTVSINRVR